MPVTRARAKCNNPATATTAAAAPAAEAKPSSRTRAKTKKAAPPEPLPPSPPPPQKPNCKSSTESGIVLESDRAGTSTSMSRMDSNSMPHPHVVEKTKKNAGTGRQTRKAKAAQQKAAAAAAVEEEEEAAVAAAAAEAEADAETAKEIHHKNTLQFVSFLDPNGDWHKKSKKILTDVDNMISAKRKQAEKLFNSIKGRNGQILDVNKTPLLRGLRSAAATASASASARKKENTGESVTSHKKQKQTGRNGKRVQEADRISEAEENEEEAEDEEGAAAGAKKTRKILKTKGTRDMERKAGNIAKAEKRPRSPPGPFKFNTVNMVTPDMFDFGPKDHDEGLPASKRILADCITPRAAAESEVELPNNETFQVTPKRGGSSQQQQQQQKQAEPAMSLNNDQEDLPVPVAVVNASSEPRINETFQVAPKNRLFSEQQQQPEPIFNLNLNNNQEKLSATFAVPITEPRNNETFQVAPKTKSKSKSGPFSQQQQQQQPDPELDLDNDEQELFVPLVEPRINQTFQVTPKGRISSQQQQQQQEQPDPVVLNVSNGQQELPVAVADAAIANAEPRVSQTFQVTPKGGLDHSSQQQQQQQEPEPVLDMDMDLSDEDEEQEDLADPPPPINEPQNTETPKNVLLSSPPLQKSSVKNVRPVNLNNVIQEEDEEEEDEDEDDKEYGDVDTESQSGSESGFASPPPADRDSLDLYHTILSEREQVQDINESLFVAGELENEADAEAEGDLDNSIDRVMAPFRGEFSPGDSSSNNYEISRLEDILDDQNNHRANKKIPMWARSGPALEGQLYLTNPRLMAAMGDPFDELSFPRPLTHFKLFPGAEPPRALLMPEVGNVQQKVAFYEEMIRL